MTTEKKPNTKKPPAEVVGSFADVMKRGPCGDGRDLYRFPNLLGHELFVLAASELQAWKAMQPELCTIERMTKAKIAERTTQYALQLMEELSNGETQTKTSE